MNRRDFTKSSILLGLGAHAGFTSMINGMTHDTSETEKYYDEKSKKLPVREFDVVVAGAGTAGVVAALAAARSGAKTAVIESKGYPGGTVVEGGTALHSFYNLWKAFPGIEKRMVVQGLAKEIIDRLISMGAATGHAEMEKGYDYDSVCTAIDTEIYKLVVFDMLNEAGVFVCVNTLLVDAIAENGIIKGVLTESRSGREFFKAHSFVDCTAYGDLSAKAGAEFKVPNDYRVCNSFGMANVDLDKYYNFLNENDAIGQFARGMRSGEIGKMVRISGRMANMPDDFAKIARKIGLSLTFTTTHDNYFMFVKVNYKLEGSPLNRDDVAKAELQIRKNQKKSLDLFRKYIPGCEKAFIARTSPSLNIRRGRLIECDYDISHEDVIEARHFNDEVFVYGFHDSAPRYQIKDGGTYGFPYRALCVKGLQNLYVSGMMITSDHRAHMSTRNTISCMAQGQAAGTAAALCSKHDTGTRQLKFDLLKEKLINGGVYFES